MLSITISNNAGTTYGLNVEELRINIDRSPIQAPLPGNVNPIIIDLGQFRAAMVLSGTLDITSGSDGTNTIASQQELEDFVTDTYLQNIDLVITLTVDGASATNTYRGKIRTFSCVVRSNQPHIWDYTLAMVTNSRT